MVVEIEVPVNLRTGDGHAPLMDETVVINGAKRKVIGGFSVEDETVGELVPIKDNFVNIKYIHKENKSNIIHFFSATKNHQIINIVSIPIHDHSSIVQGGPAHGTYASDYDEEDNG
jgi:hypothetical protein